jgi:hypothetical protein
MELIMNTITFNNVSYTEAALNNLSGPALVDLFNAVSEALNTGKPVARFADKKSAVSRTWKLLQQLPVETAAAKVVEEVEEVVTAPVASSNWATALLAPSKKETPVKKPAKSRGTNLAAPGFAPLPCREGSKQALLLDVLSREGGATMDELVAALSGGNKPWTEATVRSGFGWDMKLKGYGVRSVFDEEGTERFVIVLPAGTKGIPAHTPLKGKAKSDARQARLEV